MVNASRNNSQGIVVSFYHALHAARLIQMPGKKKKRSCFFSSATARCKKPKDSFSSDWAEKLAESDKGSYFDQEQWLKELNEQSSAEFVAFLVNM